MVSQGRKKNGEILTWPSSKLLHPIPKDEMAILGTYYNDAGVNLVYDAPFGADCQPETTALIRYGRQEMPDLVILSHSNNGSLVDSPSAYIAAHYRLRAAEIAALVGMRCAREGFPKFAIPQLPDGYAGPQFYQGDGIYHACGALPVLIEFPCGWQNLPNNHGAILDIGLAVLDEISAFGGRYRFRPRDPKWK